MLHLFIHQRTLLVLICNYVNHAVTGSHLPFWWGSQPAACPQTPAPLDSDNREELVLWGCTRNVSNHLSPLQAEWEHRVNQDWESQRCNTWLLFFYFVTKCDKMYKNVLTLTWSCPLITGWIMHWGWATKRQHTFPKRGNQNALSSGKQRQDWF